MSHQHETSPRKVLDFCCAVCPIYITFTYQPYTFIFHFSII